MEIRVAIVGIIIEDREKSQEIQGILHEYSDLIIGRMGIPNAMENLNVISLVVKGEQSRISALSGKLGNIETVTSKVIYSRRNF